MAAVRAKFLLLMVPLISVFVLLVLLFFSGAAKTTAITTSSLISNNNNNNNNNNIDKSTPSISLKGTISSSTNSNNIISSKSKLITVEPSLKTAPFTIQFSTPLNYNLLTNKDDPIEALHPDQVSSSSSNNDNNKDKIVHIFTPDKVKLTQMSVSGGTSFIPRLLYGTAWKKDRTKDLVKLAISKGFRAIDTACQPKHYHEPGVGAAVREMIDSGVVKRSDLFLQTKFTPVRGQDPSNIPYDPKLPLADQVRASFQVTLRNLQTDYVDSLLLHSPLPTVEQTLQVWAVFEEFVRANQVKYIGISNIYDAGDLEAIYNRASIKPSFIQNRFYAQTHYDPEIRQFCNSHNIRYQSFWTLTANPNILKSPVVTRLSQKYAKTPEQVFFNFISKMNISFLTGTTNEVHMLEDLSVFQFDLTPEEVRAIEALLR